ncbi:MAG: hypothetical protein RLZZ606_404 [Actinomycetota bacterium]
MKTISLQQLKTLPTKFWFVLFAALVAQISLIWVGTSSGDPYSDVRYTYSAWANSFLQNGSILGINEPWVYPYIANIPVLLPEWIWPSDYMTGWFILAVNVNMLLIAYLLGWGKQMERAKGAWFLIACIFLTGPVAMGRLEVFSLALTVLALISYLKTRESLSMQFFSLATWIKVSPMAGIITGFVASNRRIRFALHMAIGTAVLVLIGLLLGGDENLVSFITLQSDRGIQVESTIAIVWLIQLLFNVPGADVYYDNTIVTFQVAGFGVAEVSSLMTLVQFGALAITIFLGFRAKKNGADANTLFAWMFLTATMDLLVFNKVGSSQYQLWIVGAVLFGILAKTANWKPMVWVTLITSALTWLIFPIFYGSLLDGEPLGVGLLVLKNIGFIYILVYANIQLTKLGVKTKSEAA